MKKAGILGALAVSAAGLVIGVSVATSAPRATVVAVKLIEFRLLPARKSVPAGRVTFVVKNGGKIAHEFVVLRTVKRASRLLAPSGKRALEAGHVGEIEMVKPRLTKKLTLNLKPGHYSLICNFVGHYKAGQYADLTVK
jgi:uncharacterized cupredoxin-like copper-binding protein